MGNRIIQTETGTDLSRLTESKQSEARIYSVYGQEEFSRDLEQSIPEAGEHPSKSVRTFENVTLLQEGDLLIALVPARSVLISRRHDGYLFTKNYVRIRPGKELDAGYLNYLINEDPKVRRMLRRGQSGVKTPRITIGDLARLELDRIPPMEKQRAIGRAYTLWIQLKALTRYKEKLEEKILMRLLREGCE